MAVREAGPRLLRGAHSLMGEIDRKEAEETQESVEFQQATGSELGGQRGSLEEVACKGLEETESLAGQILQGKMLWCPVGSLQ